MIEVIRREEPALCFFLGDGESELAAVRACYPDLPFYTVRGNCDLRSALPSALSCIAGGVRIFASHGHLQGVKYDPALTELLDAAGEADLVLFGHTHDPLLEQRRGKTVINPGAIGRNKNAAYALLTVEGHEFHAEIKRVQN